MVLDPQKLVEPLVRYLSKRPQGKVYLALSGGVDSIVLLHIIAIARQQTDFTLHALHVDHGLQEGSNLWVQQCETLCAELDVDFSTTRLNLANSAESTARTARYEWMRSFVKYGDLLLTAHHQQDRAETILFNLLRGSGSAGLSSLRAERPFYGALLVRPLINVTKRAIVEYAQNNALQWVEDPSNQDQSYSRNHIRQTIIPILQDYRPDAVNNIARAASNLEQENSLLREIAISDLADVREQPCHTLDDSHSICIEDMDGLSRARQANLLRFWFGSLQLHMPSKKLMNSLVKSIENPPMPTAIYQEEGAQFRFYRGYLYVMPVRAQADEFQAIPWQNLEQPLPLFGEKISLGATAKLREFYSSRNQGQLQLLPREDLLNPKAPQGHSLNLKKWLQEVGVPPWRRSRLPILTLRESQQDFVLAPVDEQIHSDWIRYQDQQVAY